MYTLIRFIGLRPAQVFAYNTTTVFIIEWHLPYNVYIYIYIVHRVRTV